MSLHKVPLGKLPIKEVKSPGLAVKGKMSSLPLSPNDPESVVRKLIFCEVLEITRRSLENSRDVS